MRYGNMYLLPFVYTVLQENMMEAAVASIKARLNERDSNLKGPWLLTE